MSKKVIAAVICAICLAASGFAYAQAPEAIFDDFTIQLDKATFRNGELNVMLTMIFPDEETAQAYQYFVPDRGWTPEAVDTWYRDAYGPSWAESKALHMQELAKTDEKSAAAYDAVVPDAVMLLLASFDTPDGMHFFPEGSFDIWEFGSFSEAERDLDGTWRRTVGLTASGFKTEAEALVLGLTVFDPCGMAPYTGIADESLWIELKK